MAKAEELRVLELFSGIGGMHYALEGILHDFSTENWNVFCSFKFFIDRRLFHLQPVVFPVKLLLRLI